MNWFNRLKYLYAKAILFMQGPAERDCNISETAWIGHRSNLIRVTMGRYSYVGMNNSISDCKIGSFCSIASYCAIGGGVHPLDKVSTSPVFYDKNNCFREHKFISIPFSEECKTVVIGNDVWIGENCFIKAGVTIGDGAVVGAHSVVTKDIPPYAIVAGAPAKILRFRFDENKIKELLELQWWNWSDEQICANLEMFK